MQFKSWIERESGALFVAARNHTCHSSCKLSHDIILLWETSQGQLESDAETQIQEYRPNDSRMRFGHKVEVDSDIQFWNTWAGHVSTSTLLLI